MPRCHWLPRKQSPMMSLLHYLLFEISSGCTKINWRVGSIMLPPRHPRVLARVTRWQIYLPTQAFLGFRHAFFPTKEKGGTLDEALRMFVWEATYKIDSPHPLNLTLPHSLAPSRKDTLRRAIFHSLCRRFRGKFPLFFFFFSFLFESANP